MEKIKAIGIFGKGQIDPWGYKQLLEALQRSWDKGFVQVCVDQAIWPQLRYGIVELSRRLGFIYTVIVGKIEDIPELDDLIHLVVTEDEEPERFMIRWCSVFISVGELGDPWDDLEDAPPLLVIDTRIRKEDWKHVRKRT